MLDKDQCHGSSSVIQCIALSLEKVVAKLKADGRQVPAVLIILADNTVRELKNQYAFKYLIQHVLQNRFRLCLNLFMIVGHTHDRLGTWLSCWGGVLWPFGSALHVCGCQSERMQLVGWSLASRASLINCTQTGTPHVGAICCFPLLMIHIVISGIQTFAILAYSL